MESGQGNTSLLKPQSIAPWLWTTSDKVTPHQCIIGMFPSVAVKKQLMTQERGGKGVWKILKVLLKVAGLSEKCLSHFQGRLRREGHLF